MLESLEGGKEITVELPTDEARFRKFFLLSEDKSEDKREIADFLDDILVPDCDNSPVSVDRWSAMLGALTTIAACFQIRSWAST
jgi:hypothetical protein